MLNNFTKELENKKTLFCRLTRFAMLSAFVILIDRFNYLQLPALKSQGIPA